MYKDAKTFEKDYNSGKLPLPHVNDIKDDEYFLKRAKHTYGRYCTGLSHFGLGGYTGVGNQADSGRYIYELRAYARGQQSAQKYKQLINTKNPITKKSLVNVSWDIVQILPKFRDQALARIADHKYTAVPTAIDAASMNEKNMIESRMRMMNSPQMQTLIKKTGVKPPNSPNMMGLTTDEDIQLMNKMGGIQLAAEIEMKDATDITLNESHWYTSLERMVDENLFDLGFAGCCPYLEKATGKIKIKILDPEKLILPTSKYHDFHDINEFAYIEEKTLSQLRMEAGLDEREIYKIAKSYRNHGRNRYISQQNGNGLGSQGFREDFNQKFGHYPYDDFTVSVMTHYFIAGETEKYVEGYHDRGNRIFDQVKGTSTLNDRDKKRGKAMYQKEIEAVYLTHWVIGTNYVYDSGKEEAITRDNGRAQLPGVFYSTGTSSIVERCISHVDDIQMAVVKKRIAIAKLPPGPIRQFDLSILQNSVTIGTQKYNLLNLLDIAMATGDLFIKSRPEFANPLQQASQKSPISNVPFDIMPWIQMLLQEVMASIELVRQVTGLNDLADGTSQNDRMLKGMIQSLNTASDNALNGLYDGKRALFGMTMDRVVRKWALTVLSGDVRGAAKHRGQTLVKLKTITKNIFGQMWSIMVKAEMTTQEKQLMVQDLQMKLANEKISAADYYVLLDLIKDGDLAKAKFYIAKAVKERETKAHQAEIEKINANNQGAQQAALAAEKLKAETLAKEFALKKDLEDKKSENKRKEMRDQHMYNMTEQNAGNSKQEATTT